MDGENKIGVMRRTLLSFMQRSFKLSSHAEMKVSPFDSDDIGYGKTLREGGEAGGKQKKKNLHF